MLCSNFELNIELIKFSMNKQCINDDDQTNTLLFEGRKKIYWDCKVISDLNAKWKRTKKLNLWWKKSQVYLLIWYTRISIFNYIVIWIVDSNTKCFCNAFDCLWIWGLLAFWHVSKFIAIIEIDTRELIEELLFGIKLKLLFTLLWSYHTCSIFLCCTTDEYIQQILRDSIQCSNKRYGKFLKKITCVYTSCVFDTLHDSYTYKIRCWWQWWWLFITS